MNKHILLLPILIGVLLIPFGSANVEPSICNDINYKVERLSTYYYDEQDPVKAEFIKEKLVTFQEQQINQGCLEIEEESVPPNPLLLIIVVAAVLLIILLLFGGSGY